MTPLQEHMQSAPGCAPTGETGAPTQQGMAISCKPVVVTNFNGPLRRKAWWTAAKKVREQLASAEIVFVGTKKISTEAETRATEGEKATEEEQVERRWQEFEEQAERRLQKARRLRNARLARVMSMTNLMVQADCFTSAMRTAEKRWAIALASQRKRLAAERKARRQELSAEVETDFGGEEAWAGIPIQDLHILATIYEPYREDDEMTLQLESKFDLYFKTGTSPRSSLEEPELETCEALAQVEELLAEIPVATCLPKDDGIAVASRFSPRCFRCFNL